MGDKVVILLIPSVQGLVSTNKLVFPSGRGVAVSFIMLFSKASAFNGFVDSLPGAVCTGIAFVFELSLSDSSMRSICFFILKVLR
ncbi:hypothetical protein Lser_V15G46428 [Lactuca serriola]